MIEQRTIEKVRTRFGHVASWAVWAAAGATPKSNIADLSVLDPERNRQLTQVLHTDFVLLGLNISRPIERAFGNFHDPRPEATDYRLRAALIDSPCWGGYMTDVIKDFEEKSSGRMMDFLRHNRDFERAQIESLREELQYVGCEKPVLVALGRDAEMILRRNLIDEYRIVGVPHYAAYMAMADYRERIRLAMNAAGVAWPGT